MMILMKGNRDNAMSTEKVQLLPHHTLDIQHQPGTSHIHQYYIHHMEPEGEAKQTIYLINNNLR